MPHLLVYSDDRDPVTKLVLNAAQNPESEITCISLAEILNNVEIHDVIENGIPALCWTLPSGKKITNDSDTKLINRVFHVPSALFEGFHPEDRNYAYHEFWSYLSFALDSFKKKTASPSFLGLNNSSAPLPLQWRTVQESELSLQTPKYYFGSRSNLPSTILDGAPVLGEISSYHKWNVITEAELQKLDSLAAADRVFVYQRPAGAPVKASVFCGKIRMMNLSTGESFVSTKVESLTLRLAHLFCQEIAEILLFVDGETVVFGSIRNQVSPSILASEKESAELLQGVLS